MISETTRQDGPPENGGPPEKKRHTCLICCCIGCFVAFLTLTVAGFLYWSLLTSLLRSILVSKGASV